MPRLLFNLFVIAIFCSSPAVSQVSDTEVNSIDVDSFTDKSILEQSRLILDESKKLISSLNSTNMDKTEFLDDIRAIRLKITKRTPQLRAYIDGLRDTRDSLKAINSSSLNFGDSFPLTSIFLGSGDSTSTVLNSAENSLSIQEQIEYLKIDIEQKRQINSDALTIRRLEQDLRVLERRLAQEKEIKAESIKLREEQKIQREKERSERDATLQKIATEISNGEALSRELDDSLNILDDISGSLLESYRRSSEYTDRSTLVFAVLVGSVILGFFAVSFRSEKVRNAIFTGDSGIQFVTMFSLVIAIILFGVLKILEGKELSALLGGLSGYILGRGSIGVTPQPKSPTAAENVGS